MSTDSSNDLVWADELLLEGRNAAIRDSTVKLLVHRGVDEGKARLITEALIADNAETATERAAFDEPDELSALVGEG